MQEEPTEGMKKKKTVNKGMANRAEYYMVENQGFIGFV